MEAWTGCIAGALHEDDYRALLAQAGFTDIDIEVTRSYSAADVIDENGCCALPAIAEAHLGDGLFVSAFIRATKPATV
jgi:hypothetical protein